MFDFCAPVYNASMVRYARWMLCTLMLLIWGWVIGQGNWAQAKSFRILVPTKYSTQVKTDVVFLTLSQGQKFVRIEFSAQNGGQTSEALLDKEWNRRLRGINSGITNQQNIKLGTFQFVQRVGTAKIGNTMQAYALWCIAGDKAGFLAELSASSVEHGAQHIPDMLAMLATLDFAALPKSSESNSGPTSNPTTPSSNPNTPPAVKPNPPSSNPANTPSANKPPNQPSVESSGFMVDAGSARILEIALLGSLNVGDKSALMEEAVLLCGFDIVDRTDAKHVIKKATGSPPLGIGLTPDDVQLMAQTWGDERGVSERSYFSMMQKVARAVQYEGDLRVALQQYLSDGADTDTPTKSRIVHFLGAFGLLRNGANFLSETVEDGTISVPQFVVLSKLLSRDLFELPATAQSENLFTSILNDDNGNFTQDLVFRMPPPLERIVLPPSSTPEQKKAGGSIIVQLIESVRLNVKFKPTASLTDSPDRMERTKTTVPGTRRTLQFKLVGSIAASQITINHRTGDSAEIANDKIENAPISNAAIDWQVDVISPALIQPVRGTTKGVTDANGIFKLEVLGAPQDSNLGSDAFREDLDLPTYITWRVAYKDSPAAKAHVRLVNASPLAQSILQEALAELEWQGNLDFTLPFRDWHDKKFHGEITLSSTLTEDSTAGEPGDPKPDLVMKRTFVLSAKYRKLVAKDVMWDASDAYPPGTLDQMPAEVRARFEKEAKEIAQKPVYLSAESGSYDCFVQGSGYQNLNSGDCAEVVRKSTTLNAQGRLKLAVGLNGPAYAAIELDRKKMVGYVDIIVPYKFKRSFITRTGFAKGKYQKGANVLSDNLINFGEPSEAEKKLGGSTNRFAFPLQLTEVPGMVTFTANIRRDLGPEPKKRGVNILTIKGRIHRPKTP